MPIQIIFDFDVKPELPVIHSRENNSESQEILNANIGRITKSCKLVLELLQAGKVLTVRDAIIDYGISSLPRRVLDLKQNGYPIKDRLIDKRFKEYYL